MISGLSRKEAEEIESSGGAVLSVLGRFPVLSAAAGAACIASSAILVRLADVTPVTAAFFRCAYALPFLWAISQWENRRLGPLTGRARKLAWSAGLFFAVDLVLWHHSIAAVGAGLATVLGNLQILIVGFAAWWLLGERPHRGLIVAVPLVLVGVVLISGQVGGEAFGRDPLAGVIFGLLTSVAYAGFILVLREGARDLRRVAGPLFHATSVATVATFAFGILGGSFQMPLETKSHGWLLALAVVPQVAGWLLISVSLPRLPAAVTSMILLLQPTGAMLLGAAVLGESPSLVQMAGACLVLVAVLLSTFSARTGEAAKPLSPTGQP